MSLYRPGVSRRSFVAGALRAGAGAAVMGGSQLANLAAQVSGVDSLIVHSARPQDLETPVHLLRSWITPNELFYVRSHFYTPVIDEDMWTLRIDGEVERPAALTMAALARMPSKTIPVTLECAGNGRSFYDPPVAGVQWRKGAVGTARWTGVPLADVLRAAGLKASAKFLWLDGGDVGVGRAPDFVRSVPLEKAIDGDTLLAYRMNGERLSAAHGFPLRLIVPGWEGAYSVKWLVHIAVSDREFDGPFVSAGYRLPRSPVAPGTVVNAADTVPIRGLAVKSVLSSPAEGAVLMRGRPASIGGFAWSGESDIRRVDISTDSGRTWTPARLGRDRAPHAWRQFEYTWTPASAGSHVVLSRATDAAGAMQPLAADWNPGGYAWNAIDRLRVEVQPA